MLEFFTFENEVWVRRGDGSSERVTEQSTEIIGYILDKIEHFYPKAYTALVQEYSKCKPNLPFFRYRLVNRFCKCNFGNIDNVSDVEDSGKFNLECVPCPLRGECKYEYIICRPEFEHLITDAELRVLRLWYLGKKKEEIADALYLSIHTVNNHIRNAFTRLGIHEKSEFVKYAEQNRLFK